ncbi:ABC transporter permease [Gemmobacter fulvus]|uniref:ABC transporter permease n=1 Tax=Gemmobacter fulvus TaxID=2840474 RepID=UPI00279658ED|nr:ABC transporter permease [Gemmobacter fulvus]MDQ1849726.1 ABC transporter permease [Gemmobacter fulvus]
MKPALHAIAFRLMQAAGVALVVGVMSFLMMQAMPGDMAYRIAAARYGYDLVSADLADAVRRELGLEAGPVVQFLHWMGDLARFDLGRSLVSGQPVWDEIAHQMRASLQLAAVALGLSLLIGPPLGIYAGLHAGGLFDRVLLVVAAGFRAVPQFLLGLVLIVVLAVQLRLLPSAGHGSPAHLILPALTLALGLAAASARITRDAMAGVAASPFYAFARAKGLSDGQILRRHGLRNIGAPVVTYLGLQFVLLAEGVVVVETIFGWPGIGHALIHAVFHRDVPMVQGTALVMGLGFVVLNALVDLIARRIDPREVQA